MTLETLFAEFNGRRLKNFKKLLRIRNFFLVLADHLQKPLNVINSPRFDTKTTIDSSRRATRFNLNTDPFYKDSLCSLIRVTWFYPVKILTP